MTQNPLIETRPSLQALDTPVRPEAVFIGFGLCGLRRLTAGVPIDILGMLLPAEAVRRAVGARRIITLIADRHAMIGFSKTAVAQRAAWFEDVLERICSRLPIGPIDVRRATTFHAEKDYLARFDQITSTLGGEASEYLARQVADLDYLTDQVGPLVKVGWCLSRSKKSECAFNDERRFDRWVEPCTKKRIPFVYTKPGRVLCDRRKRAVPYVVRELDKRVCLHEGELPRQKLELARRHASIETVRGVRRHLTAIARSYTDLTGCVQRDALGRLETLIERVAA